ncbi:MAG TPA: CbiX/SirB N-terminal domain-containing protein, partial [Gemmatimonadaceae bacterium]
GGPPEVAHTMRHAAEMTRRALAAVGLALLPASAMAQAPVVGTIIVAHGGDSLWNARVYEVARAANTGGPVEVSFLMGPAARETRFQDVVARLEAKGVSEIVVVPMLVSSHSGHYDQIRYLTGEDVALSEAMTHHLHMSGIARPVTRVPLRLTKAIDRAPELARVLADRALALTATPRQQGLLIVGHGPNSAEDYAAWMEHLRVVADSVRAWTGFRDVRVELVRDDAPAPVRAEAVRRVRELIELQHLATGEEVIVVPVLVSAGSVSRDKLPSDIRGTPSRYGGEPLLPHPAMTRWIESRVREATGVFAGGQR